MSHGHAIALLQIAATGIHQDRAGGLPCRPGGFAQAAAARVHRQKQADERAKRENPSLFHFSSRLLTFFELYHGRIATSIRLWKKSGISRNKWFMARGNGANSNCAE